MLAKVLDRRSAIVVDVARRIDHTRREQAPPPASVDSGPQRKPPEDDPQADFIRAILGDTEDTWNRLF